MAHIIHVWGRLSSINVRKVVWAAQELGLDFQRTDAGKAYGLNTTPEYLRKNPNGLVPLLEDGNFVLWESNTIVRYLCAQYQPPTAATPTDKAPLYPSDLHARFDAERWMDWQQTTFNRAGGAAFIQLIRTAPHERQPALVQQSVAATEPLLTLLDAQLRERAYLGGDAFGMADIPLGCEMHRWWGMPSHLFEAVGVARHELPTYPHVQRWYQSLQQRPGARGVLDLPLA